MRVPAWLSGLGDDIRRARRQMAATPWFTAIAVGTIGLGIGANTAIYSVVDAVLLEPLPYHQPDRLVVVLQRGASPVSPANLTEWRAAATSYEGLAAAELWATTLTGVDEPERIAAVRVTSDLFPLLGVRPALGRLFGPEDEAADQAVILSDRLWRRRFGADPAIVGRTIQLNGHAMRVAGVMGPEFRFPPFWATSAELWAPFPLAARASSRSESIRVFGRLKPAVSLERARSEMATITRRLEAESPGTNAGIEVTPLTERVVGKVRPALLLLSGAVGFVLLIACANVAHLLMARAATRRREVAVRAALGASRARLARQLLVESGLLAALGGLLGLGLAEAAVRALAVVGPGSIPRLGLVRLDGSVLAFTAVLAMLTGLIFGVTPALAGSKVDLTTALRSTGARGATGDARQGRWRDGLVGSQFALAVVLLIGAGLAIRSFVARLSIDAGFEPAGVTTMVVSVAGARVGEAERRADFYRELLAGVGRLPGVESASMINHLPLAGDAWNQSYQVEGQPPAEPGQEPRAAYRVVMPDYFATVRLPLVAGRDFGPDDAQDRPGVIIVNQWLAERAWPGRDPIGQRISLDDATRQPHWLTVVGVVANAVRSDWTAGAAAEIYLPFLQSPHYRTSPSPAFAYQTLVIRTPGEPAATAAAVRRLIAQSDRDVPISEVQTLTDVVARANAEPRFYLFLLATFAGLAVTLAAVGIYGVMSYTVAQRTREIGIRMTLGADRRRILGLVVGRGAVVALAGAAVGVVAAIGLSGFMRTLLYGVTPTDPVTFAVVPVLLALVATLATLAPAVRAARIDPGTAVRSGDEPAG